MTPDIKIYGDHCVLHTAQEELLGAIVRFGRLSLNQTHLHLGLFCDVAAHGELIRRGLVNLHNVDAGRDAFECLRCEDEIYLLGSSPRGLMHAVYAFEECLAFGQEIDLNWHVKGTFRIAQRHFHPRFNNWPGERADIRYLSRLGASHCLISHDWQGSLRGLQGYVSSPIFPHAVPEEEVARNCIGLHRLTDACRDYGLGLALWITELPCQGGPWVPEAVREEWLTRFSDECLSDSGTYQGKVLCFAHPQVQAFYRDLLKRFFSEFPEVETIYLFGMDSGGEGCAPESCSRCHGISKFEQRDRLVRFLINEGEKVRPGLRVLTTGWHWESKPSEFLERQNRLPSASGVYMAAESDGWQAERQNHELLRKTRAICRARGQLFIGYDNIHLGDDATHLWGLDLQDFPLGIGAKLERWHELEVDGIFDHWGTFNEMTPSNSMACREFLLNPLADPETVCRKLAINQYAQAAGEPAFKAWQAIEKAHRVLSNCTSWAPAQWPAWYNGMSKAPLPEVLLNILENNDSKPLVAKSASGFIYNGGDTVDLLEAVGAGWRLAATHLEDAVRYLNAAIEFVDNDTPVGYSFWWNGERKPLSRREHLTRHKIYVEFMKLLGREIGLHFELRASFERLGRDAEAYFAESGTRLNEDMEACRNIVDFIDKLLRDYPEAQCCSASAWRTDYADKLKQLNASNHFFH